MVTLSGLLCVCVDKMPVEFYKVVTIVFISRPHILQSVPMPIGPLYGATDGQEHKNRNEGL